jgi:hypothetical protein
MDSKKEGKTTVLRKSNIAKKVAYCPKRAYNQLLFNIPRKGN